jgi:hypothetical protein
MLTLDLQKSAQKLQFSLKKKGLVQPPVMDLAFNMDVSGSFEDEHRRGLTNDLITRLVPWGLVFDPDKKLDVFTFSNGPGHVALVGEITVENYEGFVRENIIDKVPGWNGGTDYSYVLQRNLEHFGWEKTAEQMEIKPSKGLFSKLFGGKKEAAPSAVMTPKRSLVIHVTDGEANKSDEEKTQSVLRQSAKRNDCVYFLFIGISNQPEKFDFIGRLASDFPNVGLAVITDLKKFVDMSDDELNDLLIGDELMQWLKQTGA